MIVPPPESQLADFDFIHQSPITNHKFTLRSCFPHEASIARERTTHIDMAGDGVDLLAVDEDLDALDRWQVGGDGIDDRVDREQFGQRPAGMSDRDTVAQVHECITAVSDIERAQFGPWRYH